MVTSAGEEVRRVADEFEKLGDPHHRDIAMYLEKLARRLTELETLVKLDHELLKRVLENLDLESKAH